MRFLHRNRSTKKKASSIIALSGMNDATHLSRALPPSRRGGNARYASERMPAPRPFLRAEVFGRGGPQHRYFANFFIPRTTMAKKCCLGQNFSGISRTPLSAHQALKEPGKPGKKPTKDPGNYKRLHTKHAGVGTKISWLHP